MTSCASCGKKLDQWAGRHQTAKGMLCHNCYYTQLGDVVEQNPIVPPLDALRKWRES